MQITSWDERDLQRQKDDYAKQALAWRYRELLKQWAIIYTRLARAMANAFGEEEVLDTLEKVWWDLEYEAGKTWREDFEQSPRAALQMMFDRFHDGLQSLTSSPMAASIEGNRWELINFYCYHKEVAMELDERKIGISWCMADAAATRGWCSKIVLRCPNSQLRGDPFCYHIREIVEHVDSQEDQWSKEKSEKMGWRSIKKLEE